MFFNRLADVKKALENMQAVGLVKHWSLPYETLLTKLDNAVFYLTPANAESESVIWNELSNFRHFSFRLNQDHTFSPYEYRITFNHEEKLKNLNIDSPDL